MSADPAVATLALRALQPMMPSTPATTLLKADKQGLGPNKSLVKPHTLLHCIGLRLSVSVWSLTGRGWARAEAAINGLNGTGQDIPLELRITRAALLR